jgi:hypothetical protein
MNDVADSGRFSKIRHWWSMHKDLTVKVLISFGIVSYYGLSLINISPGSIEGPLAGKLREPTRFVCDFFGWVQNWRLFGPEIRNRNFHSLGLIGYEDGTIGSWEPPRFELLTLNQKYRKDKFHKWDQDCLPWDNYRDFWPGLARYVGNLHYDPKNKPVWFMLLRSEADIPDPRTGPILDPTHMPAHNRLLNAFTYHFRPEDFK